MLKEFVLDFRTHYVYEEASIVKRLGCNLYKTVHIIILIQFFLCVSFKKCHVDVLNCTVRIKPLRPTLQKQCYYGHNILVIGEMCISYKSVV